VASQVGLILRFAPEFLLARALVAEERAGRLQAIVFRDDQFIPNQGTYASTWRVDSARAGRGALLEHSIHDVDILRWLGGPIEAVSAAVREFHGYDAIDDVAVARLEFASGGVASLTSVWHDILERPSLRNIEIFCERLYIALDGGASGTLRWQLTGAAPQILSGDDLVRACRDRGLAPASEVVSLAGVPFFNPASAFLEAVRGERPPPLPLREAIAAHQLVDALYRSADEGGGAVRLLQRNGAR
jgi:predicted dehydrogenase